MPPYCWMNVMQPRIIVPIVITAALLACGCARKQPKPFKVDEPRISLPELDSTAIAAAVAMLPEGLPGRCPASAGAWNAAIERKISMRSTTLARTDITSVIGLSLKIGEAVRGENGFVTPVIVAGIGAEVTSLQNQDESARILADAWRGLSFDFVAGPGMIAEFSGNVPVPPELEEALASLLPILPDQESMLRGAWEFSRSRQIPLPGGASAVETLTVTGRVAGVSAGDVVVQMDFKSRLSGASTVDGVPGRIKGGAGGGRAVCRFDSMGLKSCGVSESRTASVILTPTRGRARLLEQKVSVESTISRGDGGLP